MNKKYRYLILTMAVFVMTIFIRIPIIDSGGYFNFGDVAIVFSGLVLGPLGGMLTGGIGSVMADIIGGLTKFAFITFIAKGMEGFLCGLAKNRRGFLHYSLPLLGTLSMAAIYFVGEAYLMPQLELADAISELLPNFIQALGGFVGGLILFKIYTEIISGGKVDQES